MLLVGERRQRRLAYDPGLNAAGDRIISAERCLPRLSAVQAGDKAFRAAILAADGAGAGMICRCMASVAQGSQNGSALRSATNEG